MTILHDSRLYQGHVSFSGGDHQYAIYATCVDLMEKDFLDNRHSALLAHIKSNHKKAHSDATESLCCESMDI